LSEPKYKIGQTVYEIWGYSGEGKYRETKIVAVFVRNNQFCYVYERDLEFYILERAAGEIENGPSCTGCRGEITGWHTESRVITSTVEAQERAEALAERARGVSSAAKSALEER
jgi:hypothetical protein